MANGQRVEKWEGRKRQQTVGAVIPWKYVVTAVQMGYLRTHSFTTEAAAKRYAGDIGGIVTEAHSHRVLFNFMKGDSRNGLG